MKVDGIDGENEMIRCIRVDALFFVKRNRHVQTESANKFHWKQIPLELVQASRPVVTVKRRHCHLTDNLQYRRRCRRTSMASRNGHTGIFKHSLSYFLCRRRAFIQHGCGQTPTSNGTHGWSFRTHGTSSQPRQNQGNGMRTTADYNTNLFTCIQTQNGRSRGGHLQRAETTFNWMRHLQYYLALNVD
jgi:hypothetical protein